MGDSPSRCCASNCPATRCDNELWDVGGRLWQSLDGQPPPPPIPVKTVQARGIDGWLGGSDDCPPGSSSPESGYIDDLIYGQSSFDESSCKSSVAPTGSSLSGSARTSAPSMDTEAARAATQPVPFRIENNLPEASYDDGSGGQNLYLQQPETLPLIGADGRPVTGPESATCNIMPATIESWGSGGYHLPPRDGGYPAGMASASASSGGAPMHSVGAAPGHNYTAPGSCGPGPPEVPATLSVGSDAAFAVALEMGAAASKAPIAHHKVTYEDGSTYSGPLCNGQREGEGQWKSTSGQYEGQWFADAQHGFGKQMWTDGRVYQGQFSFGRFSGEGRMVWETQKGMMSYEGQYLDDLKHGFGKFIWSDGRIYVGEWKAGQRHGRGTYMNAKREKKAGIWVEDRFEIWENADGEVHQNPAHGEATLSQQPQQQPLCK